MVELELTRTAQDRRTYALPGVGTVTVRGIFSSGATIVAGGRRWEVTREHFWSGALRLVADGQQAGRFRPSALRRSGAIEWGTRMFELRAASVWRERYALVDGKEELAVLSSRGWGKQPVSVLVRDLAAVDGPLLLFAAYVVPRLADDGTSAAVAATTAAG